MSEEAKNSYVGRVVFVGVTENVSKKADKPFYKRTIVVDSEEEGAKYANPVPFESTGDKCEYLDRYKVGDVVRIEFFLNGRAWKDPKTGAVKYFTSNRIGYIELASDADSEAEAEATVAEADADDSMPF